MLLGRPLQAFEAISQQLARQVIEQIQKTGHRHISLAVDNAHFVPQHATQQGQRPTCEAHLSRYAVQAWMALRYGFTPQACDFQPTTTPISATETRIAQQIKDAMLQAVARALPATSGTQPAPNQQLWQWHADLSIGAQPTEAIHILLSSAHSACLEALVAQQRKPTRSSLPQSQPLHVDLQALLLEKTVSAADISQLRIGSVVPIALDRALVTLNGQSMLSASVAEHQGKLHLTAFETLE